VLYLALILLLTFLVLSALAWGGTRLVQAALYEEVQPDLYWRAPATAAALTAFIGVWALLNYAAADPGQTELPFDNIFNFTTETVAQQPIPEFWAERGGTRVKYNVTDLGGVVRKYEYRDDTPQQNHWAVSRTKDVEAILIKEGDKEVRFKADPANARYVEEGGRRFLSMDAFGRITTPRSGGAFVRVLLNVLHLVVWFVCLWLLLRFQWPHALGLALALWLVMTFVVPYILRVAAEAKPAPPPASIPTARE
jgi:hypothetical protein